MSRDAPLTLGEAARSAHQALSAAGIDDPGRNGRLLVAAATGCSTGDIIAHPERQLSGGASGRLAELIERRSAHEPLSRILGEREFYGRRFALSAATLDPRPDSETLIAVALAIADREGWRDRPVRILDIGTGTGCLLLTLLAELPLASGVGTDISHEALATAAENAAALGLAERATFAAHDVLGGVEGRYDLVVSNPPYIPSGDIAGLDREVQDFDPRAALDGGVDGLDIYRRIAAGLEGVQPRWVILEVGAAQADDVACVLQKAFVKTRQAELTLHLDLGGHARCVALGLQS